MSLQKHLYGLWRTYARSSASRQTPDVKIGLSGSFTLDPLIPYAGGLLLEMGYHTPELINANYNQCLRVCLDPASEFGPAELDAIVLLWRLEDIADPSNPPKVTEARNLLLEAIERLASTFKGQIVVGLPPRPRSATDGLVDFARPDALAMLWFDTLSRLSKLSRAVPNLFLVDLEALIANLGEQVALDNRKELLYRQPYSEAVHCGIAQAFARIFRMRKSESKKCLVLDCDNTLWGGVVGEDGLGGIELSDDMPGLAFRRFQAQVAALRRSGIFIAINSKNNPEDVWEVFDKHGGMALSRSDISAAMINWQPKSDNLRAIAAELSIGLDALVFVDDSPFETEEVRAHAPEVTVFQVPEDPADLPLLMREIARLFDRPAITDDDRARVDMMAMESQRKDLRQKMTEEDFLASLGLEVFLYKPAPADLARVTQLINKTNQFNVTTKRYGQDEVARLIAEPDSDLFCASVRDKFGEYGLVGVSVVHHGVGRSEIDTLLMSCRVLGRGIETAIVQHAIGLAHLRGAKVVDGTYVPTRKNQMVEDLFARHGFERGDASGDNVVRWSFTGNGAPAPTFLKVHRKHPAENDVISDAE